MQNLSPIIEVDELMQISENQNLRIFDVRTGSNAKENYIKKHLEYSVFVDLNSDLAEIDDPKNGGRHPLPTFEDFIKTLGKLGIDKDDENNLLLDQPGLIAKDIVDVSKINANFYIGVNGGIKNIRARIGYQYGLTNFFGNLKNNDNVKLLSEKMKGNIGLISGQITIYL